jgi:hypothetical protein
MIERTTVRLPHELLERAKRKAAAEGRTLTALIEDGLRLIVGGNRPARSKTPIPRISKSAGGVWPGIDLIRTSTLEEMDDLEALRRAEPRG